MGRILRELARRYAKRGYLRVLRDRASQALDHARLERALRQHGAELVARTLAACAVADVHPHLAWGTLLGCLREGRTIDHDYDVDFWLYPEAPSEVERLKRAMQEAGFVVRREHVFTGKLAGLGYRSVISFLYPPVECWVDFSLLHPLFESVAYIEAPELTGLCLGQITNKKLLDQNFLTLAWLYPPEIFAHYKTIVFLGSKCSVSAFSDQYLTLTYGDWKRRASKTRYRYENMKILKCDPQTGQFECVDPW